MREFSTTTTTTTTTAAAAASASATTTTTLDSYSFLGFIHPIATGERFIAQRETKDLREDVAVLRQQLADSSTANVALLVGRDKAE